MINLKTIRQMINEMAAKRAGATLSNDDQGKVYELMLAKAFNGHPEVNRGDRFPRHHRAVSDNPDHSGTPAQVYDRLSKKAGKNSPEIAKIKAQARDTAHAAIQSLRDSGHLGRTETNGVKHPETRITNVFWTSNRDNKKGTGDHEMTSGIRDTNSKGDVMLTIAPQHPSGHYGESHEFYKSGHDQGVIALVEKRKAEARGETYVPPQNPHPRGSKEHKLWNEGFGHGQLATHINVSAKYAKSINYTNPGHKTIDEKTGSKGLGKLLDNERDSNDVAVAKKFGYYTTGKKGEFNASASNEKFKADRDVLDAEKEAHAEKNKERRQKKLPKLIFAPKSAAAKRAHAAYSMTNASLSRGVGHTVKTMSKMSQEGIRNLISSSVVPNTVHETLTAHSNPETGKNIVHSSEAYRQHLDEYEDFKVKHGDDEKEGGTVLQVTAKHKQSGERKPVFYMSYKTQSGAIGGRTFTAQLPQFGKSSKEKKTKQKLNEMLLERKMNQEKIMAASERASAVNKTVSKSRQISQARAAAEIASKNEKYSRQSEKATRGYKATQRQSKEGETQTHWFDDEGNLRIGGAAYAARAAKNLNLNKHSGMLGDPRRQAELEDSDKAILAGMKQAAEKSMSEEAPANAMGTAGISGADTAVDVGIAGHDMLLTPRPLRRSPPKMFGGKRVFTVPSSDYYKATLGRKKGQHWRSMVNGPLGEEIRQYALDNKDAPIIVEDETTGAMMYLRYGKR